MHSGGGGNGPGGPSGLSSTYDSLLGSPALGAPGAVPSAAFGRGGLAGMFYVHMDQQSKTEIIYVICMCRMENKGSTLLGFPVLSVHLVCH